MGKNVLTPRQHFVLDLASKERQITDWFYFTGGTALAEFYLHHRVSEDLDFFSDFEIHHEVVDSFLDKVVSLKNAHYEKKTISGHAIAMMHFPGGENLKVDFVYQPYKPLEKGKTYNDLRIASLWDMAVDKLYTIFNRAKARDFVDLYFAIKKIDCDFDQLLSALEEKYRASFDKVSLYSRLPIVKDVSDYPTMLVPFDKKEMEEYYLKLAKSLEGEIFA